MQKVARTCGIAGISVFSVWSLLYIAIFVQSIIFNFIYLNPKYDRYFYNAPTSAQWVENAVMIVFILCSMIFCILFIRQFIKTVLLKLGYLSLFTALLAVCCGILLFVPRDIYNDSLVAFIERLKLFPNTAAADTFFLTLSVVVYGIAVVLILFYMFAQLIQFLRFKKLM